MSRNYVLADYEGQTRKIVIKNWANKTFARLLTEIKAKFDLAGTRIDLKAFDKRSKRYFVIDKFEVDELRRGDLLKVILSKEQKKPGRRGKKLPMVPPGAPAYSKADDAKRKAWKIGSKVEIYSEGQSKWQRGDIVKIFKDNEGEWLVIKYMGVRTKEIQRFSNYIRPLIAGGKKGKKEVGKKADKKKADKKKSEKKPKKEKRVKRATTQDKYVKVPRVRVKEATKENEILILGRNQHVKQYIDRAYLLLKGKPAPSDDVKVPAPPSDEEETEKKGTDDEELNAEAAGDALKTEPSKVYDTIYLIGNTRSMRTLVTTAEVVKSIIGDVYQVSELTNYEVKDVWEPTEQGLKNVEIVRSALRLKITLTTNPESKELDKKAPGYQEPSAGLPKEWGFDQFKLDSEKKGRGGKGRAKRSNGRRKGTNKGGN